MSRTVRITVLVENTAHARGMLGEHGLALWIEADGQGVLFDTGQGLTIENNARQLGVGLEQTEAIVLSHGHYDHTGGLGCVLGLIRASGAPTPVYAHPAALSDKYARNGDGTSRPVGSTSLARQAVRRPPAELILTTRPTEVLAGLRVTGPIPRVTDFEDTGGAFFLDPSCRRGDPLQDDQALFFASSRGTVVLLGCGHAGVINTLGYVRQLTHHAPIYAILGGMHLGKASPRRMRQTLRALRELDVERLAPGHCTGMAATTRLWSAFPGRCIPCAVGTRMEFEVP